jgi:hypothetical protein
MPGASNLGFIGTVAWLSSPSASFLGSGAELVVAFAPLLVIFEGRWCRWVLVVCGDASGSSVVDSIANSCYRTA